MSASLDRGRSLSLVAAALEQLAREGHPQAQIDALPANLHQDALDVLVNVRHFLADDEIRRWDEGYGRMQEEHLRGLIRSLRDGASREALLRFDFLSEIPNPTQGQAFRDASRVERELLEHLLSVEFPGRQALLTQLPGLQVRPIDENGSIELRVVGGEPAQVVGRVPVEAQTSGTDGAPVRLNLHVANGLLDELHIYRDDFGPVSRLPPASAFLVGHPPRKS